MVRKSLQESFDKAVKDHVFSLSVREDSMLGGLLVGKNLSLNVQDLLNRLCPFPEFIPDVSKLVTAFNNTRTPKGSALSVRKCFLLGFAGFIIGRAIPVVV